MHSNIFLRLWSACKIDILLFPRVKCILLIRFICHICNLPIAVRSSCFWIVFTNDRIYLINHCIEISNWNDVLHCIWIVCADVLKSIFSLPTKRKSVKSFIILYYIFHGWLDLDCRFYMYIAEVATGWHNRSEDQPHICMEEFFRGSAQRFS